MRALPEFWRLLELRTVSQFGDGLFQAGLAGALLFNPERAAGPWEIAGAFAVLYLPYSLLGPFAGALLDRWDRRLVLIAANSGRLLLVLGVAALLAAGTSDLTILFGALVVNGFTRFVSSGLSAALPDVVPREQVVTMNSVATADGGRRGVPRRRRDVAVALGVRRRRHRRCHNHFHRRVAGRRRVAAVGALPPHILGPHESKRAIHGSVAYAVATGWLHGARTVVAVPSVAATLSGLAAHRMVFGINTLLVLVIVRHTHTDGVAGIGTAAMFLAAPLFGGFVATALLPVLIRRWGRYATPNGALAFAAAVQLCGSGLNLPVMVLCGFFLGAAGQVVKLCADTAMQIDVDDALRGHVFTVQDAVFWIAFIVAITLSAAIIPVDGREPALVVAGSVVYLVGLALHAGMGRRARLPR